MTNRSPFPNQRWALAFSVSGLVALIDPLRRHAGPTELALTLIGIGVFMSLYVSTLMAWKRDRSGLWQTLALAALGAFFAPFNSLAWVFSVVACAFAACVAAGDLRSTARIIGGIVGIALLGNFAVGLPWSNILRVVGIGLPTAVMCALTLRRRAALNELARDQERERIARDMHDVLGHTLSLIVLKTDLAARLVRQDPGRTAQELADVERIARETLDEVRETLRGYRARSLRHELELARHTLSIAGVEATVEFDEPDLDSAQENALCLALREGITNVVRHADAKHCKISFTESDGFCRLEIEDDGARIAPDAEKGPEPLEGTHDGTRRGSGLQGMRERIVARGGSVTRDVEHGTRLIIELPSTGGTSPSTPASRTA